MKTPQYFTLEELLTSSTARQKSIENLPSWEIVEHLNELALFLDGVRESWGSGIRVSSGYRNKKLNNAVGGVKESLHKTGYAADIQPINGKFEDFKRFIVDYLKDKMFDECIIESDKKGNRWIHIQLYSNNGFQRRKVFSLAA